MDQRVASDERHLAIYNESSQNDTPQVDDIKVLTEIPSGIAATCVGKHTEILESGSGTTYNGESVNETDARNKIENPNCSSTSYEGEKRYKNNIRKLEDIDKYGNVVRSNYEINAKMYEESAQKLKQCMTQFHSDNEDDDTDSAVTAHINLIKASIQHFNESACTEPHGNLSDESNSATPPKKSEVTNDEEGKKSKKICPIEMRDYLEVQKDTQIQKGDSKKSQNLELRLLKETVVTNLEVKLSSEETSTVTSAEDGKSEILNTLIDISKKSLKKIDKEESEDEKRKKNNEQDISKKIPQETGIKDSKVTSSGTDATCGEDQNELNVTNCHNSADKGKSKVENEIYAKTKTEASITSNSTSCEPRKNKDYIRILDDTDQDSGEVRSNNKGAKKMEEESALKLKKYKEQFYSNYADQETDVAVIEYLKERIKERIQHPYEPTCIEPHGDSTELNSKKSQKEVLISKNEVQGGAKRKKSKNIKRK